jgi:PPM family protein phosphatase
MDAFPSPHSSLSGSTGSDYDDMIAYGGYVTFPPTPRATPGGALADRGGFLQSGSELEWAQATHSGLVRLHNEDALATDQESQVFVLADGMGGYNAGEVASALSATCVLGELQAWQSQHKPDHLNDREWAQLGNRAQARAFAKANRLVIETAARRPECLGMGTTLIAAMFHSGYLQCAHVGDSRLYRWRRNTLECLTRDHSVGQEMIDSGLVKGEEARTIAARGILTRAIGAEIDVEVDMQLIRIEPGDRYILCSDGLTDMVDHAQLTALCARFQLDSCELLAKKLIEVSLAQGGADNVSVVVLGV